MWASSEIAVREASLGTTVEIVPVIRRFTFSFPPQVTYFNRSMYSVLISRHTMTQALVATTVLSHRLHVIQMETTLIVFVLAPREMGCLLFSDGDCML